jgi:hypothetical protein
VLDQVLIDLLGRAAFVRRSLFIFLFVFAQQNINAPTTVTAMGLVMDLSVGQI